MRRPLRVVPWVRPALRRQAYDSRLNEKGGVLRPSRRVMPKRTPGVWTWRPSKVERLEAWLDNHPVIESLLGIALIGGFLFVCVWLLYFVPEAGR